MTKVKLLAGLYLILAVVCAWCGFPYGTYRLPTDDFMNLEDLAKSNFSLIHAYHFEHMDYGKAWMDDARKYLNAADQKGVRVFLGFPRSLVARAEKDPEAIETVRKIVETLKNEKGLFGWYLYDEPNVEKDNRLKDIYRTVKDMDPEHPTIIVHFTPARFESIGTFCDLPWVDTYPVPWSIARVYEAVRTAKALSGKPVWSVIQAHGLEWQNAREKNTAVILDKQQRPTPKEFRAMVHAALAGGAGGIIVYFLPQRMHDMKKNTPLLWQAICAVGNELAMLSAPLEQGMDDQTCTVEVLNYTSRQRRLDKVYHGGEKGPADTYYHEKKDILSWQRAYDGKLYCGIVNASYTPQVKIKVKFNRGVRKILQLPERRPVFDRGETTQENSDVTIWRVAPDYKGFELYFNEADTIVWEVEFL